MNWKLCNKTTERREQRLIVCAGKSYEEILAFVQGNKAMNLYTLKVYLKGMGCDIYRIFRTLGDETLERLCESILEAYDLIIIKGGRTFVLDVLLEMW